MALYHEAAWSPRNDEFIVVYGFMPAKATIFSSDRCEPRYHFQAGPYNAVYGTHLAVLSALSTRQPSTRRHGFFDRKADGKYSDRVRTRFLLGNSTTLHYTLLCVVEECCD